MNNNSNNNIDLNQELLKYKRINNRNSGMIIILLCILLFVCIVTVYVRFFSWYFLLFDIKYT